MRYTKLQSSIEKPPVYISTPICEQVIPNDSGMSVAVISEERVGEDEN